MKQKQEEQERFEEAVNDNEIATALMGAGLLTLLAFGVGSVVAWMSWTMTIAFLAPSAALVVAGFFLRCHYLRRIKSLRDKMRFRMRY